MKGVLYPVRSHVHSLVSTIHALGGCQLRLPQAISCLPSVTLRVVGIVTLAMGAHALPARAQEMNLVASPPTDSTIAIIGAKLIDGRGGPPANDACIVIRGDRIADVGKRTEITIPDGATVIDAAGKTVLPGFFDTHFHSRHSVEQPIKYELHHGITSFRDPGHPFKYYETLLSSNALIPRVFLCGGHLDAPPAVWPDQAEVITSNAEAKQAVASHVANGASAIKVYFRLPLEQIRATCNAAQQRNIPVTAHLELVDADDAIKAGVIGVEHITSFGTAIASDDLSERFKSIVSEDSAARREWRFRLWAQVQIENNPKVDDLIDLIVKREVFVSPTLAIFERRQGEKDATETEVTAFKNMMAFFKRCYQAGAKVVVGSHTAAPYASRGKAFLREAELMVQAGMEPIDVLTAATKNGAEFFGVGDRLGTIETGKLADLVIVDGDPTGAIKAIDRIADVMINGQWVPGLPNSVSQQ